MGKQTIYEWDAETVDEHGDIQDHFHADSLKEVLNCIKNFPLEDGRHYEVVLVRDVWGDDGNLDERSWAYMNKDNTLPEEFADVGIEEMVPNGIRVPKRFHKEVAKCM